MKWRDLENVVARMFEKGDIRGFRKQDVVLGPGEALVIIQEGKIDEVLTQTRLKSIGGGFKNWFARKTGMGKDMVFLFVDTRPFEMETPFQGTTKDYIPLKGNITIRMQINVDDAAKLLNFMREYLVPKYKQKGIIRKKEVQDGFETEGRLLTREVISEMMVKEMSAKVFLPVIARHDASEFHSDTRVRKDLQTEALVQLRKTFDLWGLVLLDLYSRFEETDFDRTRKYAAKRTLEADMQDADFIPVLRDNERRGELKKTQMLQAEEARDITHGKAMDRYKKETLTKMEIERLEDEQDMKTIDKMVDLKERMKAQKTKEFQETELKVKELEAQKEIEKARIDVEKSKYDLNSYKQAQDSEREHHLKMMEQYGKVLGSTGGPAVTGGPSGTRICTHCGMAIQPDWKACPHCGKKV